MAERFHRLLMRQRLKRNRNSTTRVLLLFFLLAVLIGTLLLLLPVSSREDIGPKTALFTAASAVCVTGLSLVDTLTQWTTFGQVVILVLIQVGGLGYMTFISASYFLLRRRIGLRERLILQQAMALNELDGVIRLVRLVLEGTFLIEGAGALVLSLRFARLMPVPQAVWYGVFHAVSAYCNAGFDLMGQAGMARFAGDLTVNFTLIVLIILGGLGFFVWNDLLMHRFRWRRLSVHTKLVLLITAVLLAGGTFGLAALEWNNPATLGGMTAGKKWLAALFQSVTCRTAGFSTVSQADLTGSGKLLSMLLMLVGGSSGSTAGGIKTVTVGILLLTSLQVLRGRRDVVAFGRKLPQDQINSAGCICVLVVFLALLGGIVIAATNGIALSSGLYESISAICTVGLSTGVTAELNLGSQILLIVYMFFGRVGILTIGLAFMVRTPSDTVISRPETRILLG